MTPTGLVLWPVCGLVLSVRAPKKACARSRPTQDRGDLVECPTTKDERRALSQCLQCREHAGSAWVWIASSAFKLMALETLDCLLSVADYPFFEGSLHQLRLWVRGAQHPLTVGGDLFQQTDRLGEAPHRPIRASQVVSGGPSVRVFGAQQPHTVGNHLFQRTDRLSCEPCLLIESGQVDLGGQGVRVFGAEQPLTV